MTEQSWTTCLRCGAVVDQMSKHKRWHEKLEGTSEPEKGTPGKGRVIVLE
jgi:hypothetical protein